MKARGDGAVAGNRADGFAFRDFASPEKVFKTCGAARRNFRERREDFKLRIRGIIRAGRSENPQGVSRIYRALPARPDLHRRGIGIVGGRVEFEGGGEEAAVCEVAESRPARGGERARLAHDPHIFHAQNPAVADVLRVVGKPVHYLPTGAPDGRRRLAVFGSLGHLRDRPERPPLGLFRTVEQPCGYFCARLPFENFDFPRNPDARARLNGACDLYEIFPLRQNLKTPAVYEWVGRAAPFALGVTPPLRGGPDFLPAVVEPFAVPRACRLDVLGAF